MKRILTALIIMAAAVTFVSCDKYDDGKPLKNVREAFAEMYPGAHDVEWDAENGYWVVSFELGTPPDVKECEAWYDVDANWLRTETDLVDNALPQSVKDAIAASEYASALLSAGDVDYVETPSGNFYELEIYLNGLGINLKVSEDGKVSLL